MTLAFRAYLENLDPVQRLQATDKLAQLAQQLFIHTPDIEANDAFQFAEQFYLAQFDWLSDTRKPGLLSSKLSRTPTQAQ